MLESPRNGVGDLKIKWKELSNMERRTTRKQKYKKGNKQTNIQTKQTHKQTNTQTNKQTNKQINKKKNRLANHELLCVLLNNDLQDGKYWKHAKD